jgi:hypothetical protein
MQFSIHFYNPEFGISFVAALLLFAEFELRSKRFDYQENNIQT